VTVGKLGYSPGLQRHQLEGDEGKPTVLVAPLKSPEKLATAQHINVRN